MAGRKAVSVETRFWEKVHKAEGCWLWTGCTNGPKGYGMFWHGAHGRKILAHRFSFELAMGRISNEICVLHRCDTPLCVNPSHLFLGTIADNVADMIAKDRKPTSLTKEQKKLCETSLKSTHQLAKEFGVDRGVIQRNRTWVYRHNPHKLTDEQVRMCRASPKSASKLARELGVNHHVICDLRAGRTYRHVL